MRAKDLRGFGPVGTNGPKMADPTPSVSEHIPDHWSNSEIKMGLCPSGPWVRMADYEALQRELAGAREWNAELSDLLDAAKFERDQAESDLAADPCVRHSCKRVRMEMQAQIDAAKRDAERNSAIAEAYAAAPVVTLSRADVGAWNLPDSASGQTVRLVLVVGDAK